MLAADFDRLAARTSLRAAALAMARRILVDGLSAAAAGREFGRPRDVASRAAGRIRAEAVRENPARSAAGRCNAQQPVLWEARRTLVLWGALRTLGFWVASEAPTACVNH